MKRYLLSLLFLLGLLIPTEAANRFLTCTVTCTITAADTTIWGTASGGTGASVPGSSDAVILDAATCVGGVTCSATMGAAYNPSWQSITMGTCTAATSGCILDFSVNNNSITLGTFSGTGTGVRTLNMGSGTWTLTGTSGTVWNNGTTTTETFNAGTSVLAFTGVSTSNKSFTPGDKTYATVSFAANTGGVWSINNVANTIIGTLNVTAPNYFAFAQGITLTISNAFTITGSSSAFVTFISNSAPTGTATISVASGSPSLSWAVLKSMAFTGGATFSATNAIDLGNNSGITVTAPSFGGGGRIIGG